MNISRHKPNGFSLVELAVVLVIVGIVISMGLNLAVNTLDSSAASATKAKQDQLKLALIGFLRTNGRLPCADSTNGVATGIEPMPCVKGYGVVPWQTLGISRDAAIDGWGNFFTYGVSIASITGSKNWTSKIQPTTDFSVNEFKSPSAAYRVQEMDAAGNTILDINTAVVVLVSHGKNGFGAKTTRVAARMPATDAGADEVTNATDSTTTFILRPYSDTLPFDDMIAFMRPQDLLQPLVSEGTLKACQAYCPPPISSICSIPGESCSCAAPGLMGTPSSASASPTTTPCTGSCGLCTTNPITTTCSPSAGTIPVGVTPPNCI